MEDLTSWKQVPPELIFGHKEVWASYKGEVKINGIVIKRLIGPRGKYGRYPCTKINDSTVYFHRLVYFAHSNKSIDDLKNGRVIFKNIENPSLIINTNGMYRCWFEDLLFEPGKMNIDNIINTEITLSYAIHSVYGEFYYGKWMPLYIFNKKDRTAIKSDTYEICPLDKSEMPCLIKNMNKGTYIKYHFHNNHDGYVVLSHNNIPTTYLISHILLLSIFPNIPLLQTVDHIDNNSKNHNILNLQWLSVKENAQKGQSIQPKLRNKEKENVLFPDEIWKPLPINKNTLENYSISNKGRLKRNKLNSITSGSRLRGKKYSYTTITIDKNIHTKYYIHQLVYITFHGPIPDNNIILHNDLAPLNQDGTYRNWAEDLRSGNKNENGNEYHNAKRINIANITL
jgi:hypothetical protein